MFSSTNGARVDVGADDDDDEEVTTPRYELEELAGLVLRELEELVDAGRDDVVDVLDTEDNVLETLGLLEILELLDDELLVELCEVVVGMEDDEEEDVELIDELLVELLVELWEVVVGTEDDDDVLVVL
jgi:hypothetical protein